MFVATSVVCFFSDINECADNPSKCLYLLLVFTYYSDLFVFRHR